MEPTKVKPFRIILLAAFGMIALVAIFVFANFKGFSNGSAAIGNVVIWGTLPQSAVSDEIDALKKLHPAYSGISYQQVPEDSFGTQLAEAIAVGNGPDLIFISQEQLVSQQNKLSVIPYSSISQRDYLNTFVPISELYLSDQGTYAVPVAVDPLVMYYNRTLLEQAGIATPPATWEAVSGMSDRLTQRSGGQITKSLIAFGEYGNIQNARGIVSLLLLQSGSKISSITSLGIQSTINEAAAGALGTNPAESALSFYTQFADPAKTAYSWNRSMPDARQAFLSGDLALYFGYASEVSTLSAGNPNLNFDMAPVPQPATGANHVTYGKVYALAIPKASKNVAGAYSTAIALAASDMAAQTSRLFSMAPAIRAALIPSPSDRYQPVFFPQALIAQGWLSPSPSVTDTIFSTMIGNITSGRMSVSQALFTADQALDAAL